MRRVKPAKNLENARFQLLKRRIFKYLPRHPGRVLISVLAFLGLAALIAGTADMFDRGSRLRSAVMAGTAGFGLTVQDIRVQGREMTPTEDILAILGATRGTPILSVNPQKAKADLEALPWVREATVERRLPDMLYVTLTERKPLAIWQRHNQQVLIDYDGVVIGADHLERFSALPMVVGDDAPAEALALITVLQHEPEMMKRVTAAIRVGGRRWDLRLDNNIDVELPEGNIADAWTHLAAIDREHGLLARAIDLVDLRLSDRVVVHEAADPAKPAAPTRHAKPTAKNT